MSKPDEVDRFNAAARNGRRIDRIFQARCAEHDLDPEAAMAAGPLLSLAEQICRGGRYPPRTPPRKTNVAGPQAVSCTGEKWWTSPPEAGYSKNRRAG